MGPKPEGTSAGESDGGGVGGNLDAGNIFSNFCSRRGDSGDWVLISRGDGRASDRAFRVERRRRVGEACLFNCKVESSQDMTTYITLPERMPMMVAMLKYM
jgi:hypothetical protein